MTTVEVSEWSFPDVEEISEPHEIDLSAYIMPNLNDAINSQEEVKSEYNNVIEDSEIIEMKRKAVQELERAEFLRSEYEKNLNNVEQILSKLKNPVSIIDEELMDLVQDIIKKMVKKITLTAIDADPNLLLQMIAEMKAAIDSKDGMVSVFVSSEDYQRLASNFNHLSNIANVNEELNEGDVLVKSNFAEIRAILNERIDQMIRIHHD